MDEYIRKEDAIRLAEQGQVQGFPWQFQMLVRLHPADVVPVVRCRDCKYWHRALRPDGTELINFSDCEKISAGDGRDFFCGYGERKE